MRKVIQSIFTIVLIVSVSPGLSQTSVLISKPELEVVGNQVKITYNIENYGLGDEFNVWIEITDTDGKPINARSMSGDIGEVIGGNGKEITWNHAADGVSLDVGINVQVFAEIIRPDVVHPNEMVMDNSGQMSTASIVMQSLAFPGLGLSRATGKPHWMRGVAGYGCVVSAIAVNQLAKKSYEDYKSESDIDTRDRMFEKAIAQDNISEVLAYAAIGIWIVDIVWNFVGSSRLNTQRYGQNRNIIINPSFEPMNHAPMLAIGFKF